MAKKKIDLFEPRIYMDMAIQVMHNSIPEPRDDGKTSPKVGVVLLKPDNTVEMACRGELRLGDHAEFTLIERKNRANNLQGSKLFATLEPCAPGSRRHPKLGCAERIVNARITEVWVGIEDPDPTVDRKGIKFLEDNGIIVHMFDADLQDTIRKENSDFLIQAEERAKNVQIAPPEILLSQTENVERTVAMADFSREELEHFMQKSHLTMKWNTPEFYSVLQQLGLIEKVAENSYRPTGIGFLLFGKNPQLRYPQAVIKASFQRGGKEEIADFSGPLVSQPKQVEAWYQERIPSHIERSSMERKEVYEFPLIVLKEAITNALLHRDYDIEGAPIHLELTDDEIIVRSPGLPVSPLTVAQIQSLSAPSLSRNPKIMYVFNQLHLAEQRGLGLKTIQSLQSEYNLPLPVIQYNAPYLEMVFSRSSQPLRVRKEHAGLKAEEQEGYDFIRRVGGLTKKEYAQVFEYSDRQAERHLKRFQELGLIQKKASGPYTYYELIPT